MKPDNSPYAVLDRKEILEVLFYPRKELHEPARHPNYSEILIPVDDSVSVGARLYTAGESAPILLFFHGNGEIVADYDELAMVYRQMGIGFLPVDYRGYGKSSGKPTVSAMMRDANSVFEFIRSYLNRRKHTGPLYIMGRSLGSASALEIASKYTEFIKGLIIESGFARINPLLQIMGVDTGSLGLNDASAPDNIGRMKLYTKPLLIIHAEKDHIIPFSDGVELFNACVSAKKYFLEIKEANHNTIFQYGLSEYLQAINDFVKKA